MSKLRSIYNLSLIAEQIPTSVSGPFAGDIVGTQSSMQIASGVILDADISGSANIADSKLATISTAGKVLNSATTATSANTNNAIVARDASGVINVFTVIGNLDSTAASTLNIGTSGANTVNIGTTTSTQIVNVGTGSGTTTINLGGTGDTVNIAGTLAYINTTNLNVTDKNIVLNKNGSSGSGTGSGISIEENGTNTGYIQTDGTRDFWQFKAPSTSGIVSIYPGSSGYTINQGSHNPVTVSTPGYGWYIDPNTQIATVTFANAISNGTLSSTDWITFNNAATAVSTGLSSNITGALNNTQISAGAIVNADINASAGIVDTKLATISTAGKVSNSATTATAANTNGTIVLRDNSGGTNVGPLIVNGATTMRDNLYLARYPSGGDYRVISMDGGNSTGYIYANFSGLGDGIHLGYNFYYPTGTTTPTITAPGGATSRLSLGYGSISFCTGGNGVAPIEYMRINNAGVIGTQNGASFSGPLTGNVTGNVTRNVTGSITGSCTQIKTSNGAVSTNANVSPTAAGMSLISTSTTDAKWDYAAPLTCFCNTGYWTTSSSTMVLVDTIASALPTSGKYLVTFHCPNYTNTNNAAYNNFELQQAGVGATIAYTIAANSVTKTWELKTVFNFSLTGTITIYGSTSVGTATFDQFYMTLLKINEFS